MASRPCCVRLKAVLFHFVAHLFCAVYSFALPFPGILCHQRRIRIKSGISRSDGLQPVGLYVARGGEGGSCWSECRKPGSECNPVRAIA